MKKIILILFLIPLLLSGQFAGGDGSSGDPWQIENQVEFDQIRSHLADYFILNNDISFNTTNFTPIGKHSAPFTGQLDGDGYKLVGIYLNHLSVNSADTGYVGIFGCIEDATLKDFIVQDGTYAGRTGASSATAFGYFWNGIVVGASLGNSVIENVSVKGCDNDNIWNVWTKGSVSNFYGFCGMLVGYNEGTITYCSGIESYFSPKFDVSFTSVIPTANTRMGGLIGSNIGTVQKSSSHISYLYYTDNTISQSDIKVFGGFIGYSDDPSVVDDCYALTMGVAEWQPISTSGAIITQSLGGFTGFSDIEATRCWSRFNAENATYLTSTVMSQYGYFNGSIQAGEIEAISCVATPQGFDDIPSANKGMYEVGVVYSADTTQMKDLTFWMGRGYDFTSVWGLSDSLNYGYPYLQGVPVVGTPQLPGKPQLFLPVNNSLGQRADTLFFSWLSTLHTNDYYYEIRKVSDNSIFEYGITTNRALNILNLEYYTYYKWNITARNGAGNTISDTWYFTTEEDTASLNKAYIIMPEKDTIDIALDYTFKWYSVDSATKYRFQLYNLDWDGFELDSLTTTTDTTLSIVPDMMMGTYYRVRVRAENATYVGEYSDYHIFSTLDLTPDTTTLIAPIGVDSVNLGGENAIWNKVIGASYYYVQFIDTLTLDTTWQGAVLDTFKVLLSSELNPKSTYKWRVQVHNLAYNSAYTSFWEFTTAAQTGGGGTIPPLPPLGGSDCWDGEGGIITTPTTMTTDWQWLDIQGGGGYMSLGSRIAFSCNPETGEDTMYVNAHSTNNDKNVYKYPAGFRGDEWTMENANSTWMADSTQYWAEIILKVTGPTLEMGGQTSGDFREQVEAATQGSPAVNSWVNMTDTTIYGTSFQYSGTISTLNFVILENGIAVKKNSTWWDGNSIFKLAASVKVPSIEAARYNNDSSFAWGHIGPKGGNISGNYDSASTYTLTHWAYAPDSTDGMWKKNMWQYQSTQPVNDSVDSLESITEVFSINETYYFITSNVNLYATLPNGQMKLYELTDTSSSYGVNKLFDMDNSTDWGSLDIIELWDSDTVNGVSNSEYGVVDNFWLDTLNCRWWFYAWRSDTVGTGDLFYVDRFGVVTLVDFLPTPAESSLDLSSILVTPTGEDIFMIWQNWESDELGADTVIGFRIHALTEVVDTMNIPYISLGDGGLGDTLGIFYSMAYHDSTIYLIRNLWPSGRHGILLNQGDGRNTDRIWYTHVNPASRGGTQPGGAEAPQFRGIKPKAIKHGL